jgi:hypothetical protein
MLGDSSVALKIETACTVCLGVFCVGTLDSYFNDEFQFGCLILKRNRKFLHLSHSLSSDSSEALTDLTAVTVLTALTVLTATVELSVTHELTVQIGSQND